MPVHTSSLLSSLSTKVIFSKRRVWTPNYKRIPSQRHGVHLHICHTFLIIFTSAFSHLSPANSGAEVKVVLLICYAGLVMSPLHNPRNSTVQYSTVSINTLAKDRVIENRLGKEIKRSSNLQKDHSSLLLDKPQKVT